MTKTEELLKLAEAATPGPWGIKNDSAGGMDEVCCHWHEVGPFALTGEEADGNSKFIATANPTTIKQLVELVRLQHAALLVEACLYVDRDPKDGPSDDLREAITAYERFENGEL